MKHAVHYFETYLISIIFVENAYFSGMCGINGEIYISTNNILRNAIFKDNLLQNKVEESKAVVIVTVLLEMSHALLRQSMKNWLRISPRSKLDIEKIESGFEFEDILFTTSIVDYANASGVTDLKKWDDLNKPILSEDDIKYQKNLNVNLNIRFSGIFFQNAPVCLLKI